MSLKNVLVVLTFLAGLTALADPITFTWDPSRSSPALAGPGSGFTADTINTTNYLHSVNQSNGSFVEELVLRVNSFDQNGQTVVSPGLNRSYGLYFAIIHVFLPLA